MVPPKPSVVSTPPTPSVNPQPAKPVQSSVKSGPQLPETGQASDKALLALGVAAEVAAVMGIAYNIVVVKTFKVITKKQLETFVSSCFCFFKFAIVILGHELNIGSLKE
ncbi:MAG: hypothetical protein ACLUP5_08040 [Streptococcus sp.]